MVQGGVTVIKVLVPKLPTTESLIPYLKMIEGSRHASNFGQLVQLLERRLSERYHGAHVVTVANCTLGLETVLQCEREDGADRIGFPALTFPATALAARHAGLTVLLDDVDPDTWGDGYVSAFGLPGYGPGVIDAAGAFGEQEVPRGTVAVFSLHATKPLGAGEGGFIVTHDAQQAARYRRMTNFGMQNGVSLGDGTNAKMSEYHAAVALASLDAWDREPWLNLFDMYTDFLPACVRPQKRARGVYSLMPVLLPCDAAPVLSEMARFGIECRRWYHPCVAEHPLFTVENWRRKFPVTALLSDRLLGLPWHLHLTRTQVEGICWALAESVKTHGQKREGENSSGSMEESQSRAG